MPERPEQVGPTSFCVNGVFFLTQCQGRERSTLTINDAYQEAGSAALSKTQIRVPTDTLIKNCRIQLLEPAACGSAAVRAQPALAFIVEPEKAEGLKEKPSPDMLDTNEGAKRTSVRRERKRRKKQKGIYMQGARWRCAKKCGNEPQT